LIVYADKDNKILKLDLFFNITKTIK